jgi:hypothetical protein
MLFYERMHFFEKQVEAGFALQSHVAVSRKLNELCSWDRAGQQLPFLNRHDLVPLNMKNVELYPLLLHETCPFLKAR